MIAGVIVVVLGARPEACPECTDPDYPTDCSIDDQNVSGFKTCKHLCCKADEGCEVKTFMPDSGRADREPYCVSVAYCDWESGARNNHDKYNPDSECCTDYGVEPKYPPRYLDKCQDKTQADGVIEANGCGTRDKSVQEDFVFGKTKVSFRKACNAHDVCYGTCGSSQSKCNDKFEKALKKTCNKVKRGAARKACNAQAATYVDAVRLFGSSAFDDSQKQSCKCCP